MQMPFPPAQPTCPLVSRCLQTCVLQTGEQIMLPSAFVFHKCRLSS